MIVFIGIVYFSSPFVDEWQKGEKNLGLYMHVLLIFYAYIQVFYDFYYIFLLLFIGIWAYIEYLYVYCYAWVKGEFYKAYL